MAHDPQGYYKILGLEAGASVKDVKSAFNKMQVKYHPDGPVIKGRLSKAKTEAEKKAIIDECNEMSQKLNLAKTILFDEKKKKDYDSGMSEFSGGNFGGADIFDIFSQFTGGGRRQERPKKGRDVEVEFKISTKDAFLGFSKSFSVKVDRKCVKCNGKGGEDVQSCQKCGGRGRVEVQRRMGPLITVSEVSCSSCNGQGKIMKGPACTDCSGRQYKETNENIEVVIKPGVRDGERIIYRGKGYHKIDGTPGDVIVTIRVIPDSRFERRGMDLISSVNISLYTSLVGGSVFFEHIDGRNLEVVIRPFTDFNKNIIVYNEGFKGSPTSGHLYLKPNIIIDRNINKEKLAQVISSKVDKPERSYTSKTGDFANLPAEEKAYNNQESSDEGATQGRDFFSRFGFF